MGAGKLLVSDEEIVEAGAVAGRVAACLAQVHGRFAGHFGRSEPRATALAYMLGLAAPLERRNGWTIAEQAGRATPYAMQDLLDRASWDARLVARETRAFVVEHLGDQGAVLVGDETGFLKKGTKSAGVQRQYSGTAGRRENCQIGTFLAYASPAGRTFLDGELYMPEASWIGDRARCRGAGVPDEVGFHTKPEQLRLMVERAVAEGVPFAWLTADEAYGQNPALRGWLHGQDISYVMATRCDERVDVDGGRREVRDLVRDLPWHRWRRISAGKGAHGEREYDWCRVKISCELVDRSRWVMARRSLSTGEIAYYLCFGPSNTSLKALVRVAATRWAVEESFQTAKNECGLDQYQVRKYHAWYRHMALSIAVHAALTVARAAERNPAKGAADRERMS